MPRKKMTPNNKPRKKMTPNNKPRKKRSNEILFTLTGEIGDWLMEEAAKRGLIEKRGGIQLLIHEKLHQQKLAESTA